VCVPHCRFEAIWLALWSQGGNTPDFKWQGWSNGGKYQNPKKSLGPPTTWTLTPPPQKKKKKKPNPKLQTIKKYQKKFKFKDKHNNWP